jgi:hypothetical protein
MKPNDVVTLICVLNNGHVPLTTTAEEASKHIKEWVYALKEIQSSGHVPSQAALAAERWLSHGIFSIVNDETGVVSAVLVREIVGMYIKIDNPTYLEYVEAQKTIAAAVKKQSKKGEEWRGDEDE